MMTIKSNVDYTNLMVNEDLTSSLEIRAKYSDLIHIHKYKMGIGLRRWFFVRVDGHRADFIPLYWLHSHIYLPPLYGKTP